VARNDVERLRPDAAGRSQDGNSPLHEFTSRYSEITPMRYSAK
jgi:hypothetical protein